MGLSLMVAAASVTIYLVELFSTARSQSSREGRRQSFRATFGPQGSVFDEFVNAHEYYT